VTSGGARGGASAPGCVVLAYGAGAGAVRVVERLRTEGIPAEAIVVVHNPDGPASRPPVMPAGVRLEANAANVGYAAGMNRGLRALLERGADPLLLVTQDVGIPAGAIRALLAALDSTPEHGALAPLLAEPSGRPFSHGMRRLAGGGLAHRRGRPPAGSTAWDCDALDGSLLLLRADALRAAGLFDEPFFMYCEEGELCLRLRRAGRRLAVVPAAVVEQSSGAPSRAAAFGYLMGRNGLELARRDAGIAGVGIGLLRYAADTAMVLASLVAPGRELNGRFELIRLVGLWAGTLAFFARRFGPPPRMLAGDIRGS